MAKVNGVLTTPVSGFNGIFSINGEAFSGTGNGRLFESRWTLHNSFVLDKNNSDNTTLVFGNDKNIYILDPSDPENGVQVGTWDENSTFDYQYTEKSMNRLRTDINSREDELFRVNASNYQSFNSNFQDTMLAGIVVAMLGTTVLFYTFRQL